VSIARALVSVPEAVPTGIFLRPFCEQFAGILVESETGRCAHAKTFMQLNTLDK